MQKRYKPLFSTLTYRLPDHFPVTAALEMRMAAPGRYLPVPHVHNVLEIGYCHDGRGVFSIADKILPFRTGDLVVINQHEAHCAANAHGVSSRWSWIFLDAAKLLTPWGVAPEILDTSRLCGRAFCNVLGEPALSGAAATVRLAVDELRERRPGYEDAVRGLLLALLIRLQRLDGVAGANRPTGAGRELMERLTPAVQLIHSRCAQKITAPELAQACGMSPAYLRRNFRRLFGRSPHQYLQQYRLSMAAAELEATRWTVEAIAAKYGFPTLSCFVRAFKKLHGLPPRKWARGNRQRKG